MSNKLKDRMRELVEEAATSNRRQVELRNWACELRDRIRDIYLDLWDGDYEQAKRDAANAEVACQERHNVIAFGGPYTTPTDPPEEK